MAANKDGSSALLLVGALGLAGAYIFFRFSGDAAPPGTPGPDLEPPDPLPGDTSPPTGKLSKLEIGYV